MLEVAFPSNHTATLEKILLDDSFKPFMWSNA